MNDVTPSMRLDGTKASPTQRSRRRVVSDSRGSGRASGAGAERHSATAQATSSRTSTP